MTLPSNTALTAENVGLLKAGDWLRVERGHALLQRGDLVQFERPSNTGGISNCIVIIHPNADPGFGYKPTRFTYIGPDLGDGWIGWSGGENPVPGMSVIGRSPMGFETGQAVSENLNWPNITAFRPALSPPAEGEEHICEWRLIAETQDAQYARVTAMIDAAKEAGWAMMEVVDSIAWEKRQQFSDITARLAKSIEAVECQEPATPTPAPVDHIGDATEKIDWERVGPKLVEALKEARSDIIDFVTARWSEYEGTRDDAVAYINAALDAAQPEAGK